MLSTDTNQNQITTGPTSNHARIYSRKVTSIMVAPSLLLLAALIWELSFWYHGHSTASDYQIGILLRDSSAGRSSENPIMLNLKKLQVRSWLSVHSCLQVMLRRVNKGNTVYLRYGEGRVWVWGIPMWSNISIQRSENLKLNITAMNGAYSVP